MGGLHAQMPDPSYPLQASFHPTPRHGPSPFPHMHVLPEGDALERIIGRFYIACEHHWLPWRRKWRVYELCDDLAFRTYGTNLPSKLLAENLAADMFWLTQRAITDASAAAAGSAAA